MRHFFCTKKQVFVLILCLCWTGSSLSVPPIKQKRVNIKKLVDKAIKEAPKKESVAAVNKLLLDTQVQIKKIAQGKRSFGLVETMYKSDLMRLKSSLEEQAAELLAEEIADRTKEEMRKAKTKIALEEHKKRAEMEMEEKKGSIDPEVYKEEMEDIKKAHDAREKEINISTWEEKFRELAEKTAKAKDLTALVKLAKDAAIQGEQAYKENRNNDLFLAIVKPAFEAKINQLSKVFEVELNNERNKKIETIKKAKTEADILGIPIETAPFVVKSLTLQAAIKTIGELFYISAAPTADSIAKKTEETKKAIREAQSKRAEQLKIKKIVLETLSTEEILKASKMVEEKLKKIVIGKTIPEVIAAANLAGELGDEVMQNIEKLKASNEKAAELAVKEADVMARKKLQDQVAAHKKEIEQFMDATTKVIVRISMGADERAKEFARNLKKELEEVKSEYQKIEANIKIPDTASDLNEASKKQAAIKGRVGQLVNLYNLVVDFKDAENLEKQFDTLDKQATEKWIQANKAYNEALEEEERKLKEEREKQKRELEEQKEREEQAVKLLGEAQQFEQEFAKVKDKAALKALKKEADTFLANLRGPKRIITTEKEKQIKAVFDFEASLARVRLILDDKIPVMQRTDYLQTPFEYLGFPLTIKQAKNSLEQAQSLLGNLKDLTSEDIPAKTEKLDGLSTKFQNYLKQAIENAITNSYQAHWEDKKNLAFIPTIRSFEYVISQVFDESKGLLAEKDSANLMGQFNKVKTDIDLEVAEQRTKNLGSKLEKDKLIEEIEKIAKRIPRNANEGYIEGATEAIKNLPAQSMPELKKAVTDVKGKSLESYQTIFLENLLKELS